MIIPFVRVSRCRRAAAWLVCLGLGWLTLSTVPTLAQDRPLVLMIQPMQSQEATRRAFQPLADTLAKATGSPVTIITPPNFLAYWQMVRRNAGYDLVLDDAHFTDYRIQKFGFHVLARIPGMVSYSLIVLKQRQVLDPLALAGKPVASFGPPSIAATRLSALFPNPARRPTIIDITSSAEGLALLLQGKVSAAMLPTSFVAEHAGNHPLRVITITEPTPQMALSASPRVNALVRARVGAVLLEPMTTTALHTAGIERFEAATPAVYANQSRLLKQYWGY